MAKLDVRMDMGMGMDGAGADMFHATNMRLARAFWYTIAALVGVLACRRIVDRARVWLSQRNRKTSAAESYFFHAYDTTKAIFREMAYPTIVFAGFARYFSPPSLGKCLFMMVYWLIILTMLWSNVILSPSSDMYPYKWEIVGFRAAWVTVMQLPLVYCLSCKINVISIITGISYERLNWLHRWVARTMFLTGIVHWSYFYREWDLAHFVSFEFQYMPMVKYGFGAWAVIGWMVLTGMGFLRSQCYELFVLQHIAAAAVLLWLVHVHVPSYATYHVWMAVAFIAFDRVGRITLLVFRNLRLGRLSKLAVGYESHVEQLSGDYLRVAVKGAEFSWRPGQHVYITMPRIGLLESHPFTISNGADGSGELNLYIKAHSGFTRRLYKSSRQSSHYRAFISGPWGNPPQVDQYESLVLIACGTGASFTVPLLEAASSRKNLRQLGFVWILRDQSQISWFRDQVLAAAGRAKDLKMDVSVQIFVTDRTQRGKSASVSSSCSVSPDAKLLPPSGVTHRLDDLEIEYGRPSLEKVLLPTIERALGETGILACGGASFTADLKNYVAKTSDERAVHKGTGAQGLHLYCEKYGW